MIYIALLWSAGIGHYHDSIDMPPRWGGGTAINMSLRWG